MARRERRIGAVRYDPALPVYGVWDLGKGPNMVVGLFQRGPSRDVRLIEQCGCAETEGINGMIPILQGALRLRQALRAHDIKATDVSTARRGSRRRRSSDDVDDERIVPGFPLRDGDTIDVHGRRQST